ncbi:MAG: hypothetical protein ABIN89_02115 [Chitinophagaceae bacterium]
MLKKLFGMLALTCSGLVAFTQSDSSKGRNISPSFDSRPPIEPVIKPLFMVQGAMTKFFADYDGSLATSISVGIKYLNKFGITANVQPTGFDYGRADYIPVSLELSFTAEKHKIRPFANIQLGHVFSNSGYVISSGNIKITSETKGTAFFSPGMGVLFPVKKQSGILLTLSYINSGIKTKTTAESPGGAVNVFSKDNNSGFRIAIGFKF